MQRSAFTVSGIAASVFVVGTALFLFNSSSADESQKIAQKTPHHDHGGFDACAKACSDCQRACDSCAAHCARMVGDGKKDHMKTLQSCTDCADFCSAASQIVARGGPFADLICTACADACARCGKLCADFPTDEHMKMCADQCRACEKACREMLKHAERPTSKS